MLSAGCSTLPWGNLTELVIALAALHAGQYMYRKTKNQFQREGRTDSTLREL